MTKIENVKSIKLNGHELTRVAENYKENSINKEKTIMTVKAAEELFSRGGSTAKVDKDRFRKLSENIQTDSMTFHEVINPSTGLTELREDVYGFKIILTDEEHFKFDCSIDPFKITDDFVFVSNVIYNTDTMKKYTYLKPENPYEDPLFLELYVETFDIYFSKDFNISTGIKTTINSTTINAHNINPTKFLFDVFVPESETETFTVSTNIFINLSYKEIGLNQNVYVELLDDSTVYLGKRFFDSVDMDKMMNMFIRGIFGNWDYFEGTIVVKRSSINTSFPVDDMILEFVGTGMALDSEYAEIILVD